MTTVPVVAFARIALVLIVAASCAGHALAGTDPSPTYRGRPLAEVLEELQSRGLRLIFSSAVVAPDLVVTDEPKAADPRTILDQILAPLGLQARSGAQGAILIVPAERPRETPPLTDARLVETIVVTPPHPKLAAQELGAERTLGRDEVIASPALGGDPSRVVTLLPGIAAADASAAFYPRGGDSKDVSLILDGLELYDPFHLGALQSPFSFIDGRIVDSVDFVGGGFTADRGDRHGGFLEISSTSAAEHASTQLEVGSLNSRVAYDAPTPFGELLVSARYWYPEAVGSTMTFGADGLRPKFGDVYAKLTLVSTARTSVSGHVLLASDRATLVEEDGNERLSSSNGSGYLWFRASHAWSPAVATDTVISGGRLDRVRRGLAEPDDELVALDDERDVEFLGVRNDATWSLGKSHVLRGGVDLQFLEADLAHAFGPPGASSSVTLARSGCSIGTYAAYRAAIGSRVVAEAGVRWDRQSYTGDSQWSPRLNLVWQAGERSEFRLGVGRFAQSLRIHELRIEDGETTYGPPEISRQLDLTYLHRFAKRWSLRLDAYRHELSQLQPRYENLFNPLELFPEVESDRVLVKPESATLQGVEVSARSDGGAPLLWSASYTWSRATDVIAGRDVLRSWDQTHAGGFLVGYRWRPGWFASLYGTLHTGWPTTPVVANLVTLPDGSTDIEPSPGPRNSERLPTYARLDLKGGRAIATRKGTVRVELAIMNVTDRNNACCLDEVQFETRPAGGIESTTTLEYWLGITPSLQVLWTF